MLVRAVNATDDQKARIEQLSLAWDKASAVLRDGNRAKLGELKTALEAAMKAGEQDKQAEIRQQIAAIRGEEVKRSEQFEADVLALLTRQQGRDWNAFRLYRRVKQYLRGVDLSELSDRPVPSHSRSVHCHPCRESPACSHGG